MRIFVMGANEWRDEQEWPLARTQWTRYYLHSGGRANSRFGDGALAPAPPDAEPTDGYRYDPARPVPFITEPTSSQIGGPDDYAAVERRDDVLVYVTEPLAQDIEVTGPDHGRSLRRVIGARYRFHGQAARCLAERLRRSGSAMAWCARASARGWRRPSLIEPGEIYQYTIDCWHTAQVFRAGHRIGLEIASSAFPKFDRNLNTGAPLGQTSEMAVAEQVIYHDAEHPSAVILPIIPVVSGKTSDA